MMSEAVIVVIAVLFGAMGLAGIVMPIRLLRFVGSEPLGMDGRNEARAVYGGFGMMMCGLLFYAIPASDFRAGILLCVGLALISMAAGRVLSLVIDRGISPLAVGILICEVFGGAALIWAL